MVPSTFEKYKVLQKFQVQIQESINHKMGYI